MAEMTGPEGYWPGRSCRMRAGILSEQSVGHHVSGQSGQERSQSSSQYRMLSQG